MVKESVSVTHRVKSQLPVSPPPDIEFGSLVLLKRIGKFNLSLQKWSMNANAQERATKVITP